MWVSKKEWNKLKTDIETLKTQLSESMNDVDNLMCIHQELSGCVSSPINKKSSMIANECNYFSFLTHYDETARTKSAGLVTLQEIAEFCIDGKPITRFDTVKTKKEIKPKCSFGYSEQDDELDMESVCMM